MRSAGPFARDVRVAMIGSYPIVPGLVSHEASAYAAPVGPWRV
jgi:hypothetical protein